MKKVLFITLVVAIVGCTAPAGDVAVEGVGFFKPMPGEKFVTGSDAVMDVWLKYLEAHNNQDMETIMSISADSIYVLGPDGSEIKTKEEQAALLEGWFAAANPKWDAYWGMPYKSVPSGADWVIAGHNVTQTIDGEETSELHMIDGEIKDGKVVRFFVYSIQPKTE